MACSFHTVLSLVPNSSEWPASPKYHMTAVIVIYAQEIAQFAQDRRPRVRGGRPPLDNA